MEEAFFYRKRHTLSSHAPFGIRDVSAAALSGWKLESLCAICKRHDRSLQTRQRKARYTEVNAEKSQKGMESDVP